MARTERADARVAASGSLRQGDRGGEPSRSRCRVSIDPLPRNRPGRPEHPIDDAAGGKPPAVTPVPQVEAPDDHEDGEEVEEERDGRNELGADQEVFVTGGASHDIFTGTP
jgi:hypothetical protein